MFEQIHDKILQWSQNFVEDFGPNVLLYTSFDQPTNTICDWCSENQFEIVCVHNEDFVEEDRGSLSHLKEKVGFERIYEALETNMWENMEYMTDLRPNNEQLPKSHVIKEQDDEILNDISHFNEMFLKGLTFNDESEEQFDHYEKIISELGRMKSMAEGLPDEKRRDIAASIALTISNLLGDSDED